MSSPQPHIFLHPSTIIYYLSAFWSYYRSPHRLYWHNMTEINRVNRQKSTKIDANWQESLKSTSFEFREIPIFDYGKSQHVLTKYRHVSWKYRHVQTEVDCWIYPQNVKVADGGAYKVLECIVWKAEWVHRGRPAMSTCQYVDIPIYRQKRTGIPTHSYRYVDMSI